MSKKEVVKTLSAAAKTTKRIQIPSFAELLAPGAKALESQFVSTEPKALESLIEALSECSELDVFDGGKLRFLSIAIDLSYTIVANWLCLSVAEGASPEDATNLLFSLVEENKATRMRIHALSGIIPQVSAQLTDEIELVPIENLPDSLSKRAATTIILTTSSVRAEAALIHRYEVDPLFVKNYSSEDQKSDTDFTWDILEIMDTVTEGLVLVGPSSPHSMLEWDSFEANVPGGNMPGNQENRFEIIGRPRILGEFDAEVAVQVTRGILELSKKDIQHIRISLKRLMQAQRRLGDVNRAIDLGIAFEALLLPDSSRDQPISLPMKLRSAWLMEDSVEKRRKIFREVADLYSLRSSAVHKGQIPQQMRGRPVNDVLDEGAKLCAELAKRIISNGGYGDWSSLILGGNA